MEEKIKQFFKELADERRELKRQLNALPKRNFAGESEVLHVDRERLHSRISQLEIALSMAERILLGNNLSLIQS